MANLGQWQRIDRILPGLPWGNAVSGPGTISSDQNTYATAIGSASSPALTIGSAILNNGDVFYIIQTQGTGVGQNEIQKVLSGGGTTSITCLVPLHYTYGTGAQVVKFPMNTTATVNAHSVTPWDGSIGGIEIICAETSITISQALNGAGINGILSGGGGVFNTGITPGGGFRGGYAHGDNPPGSNAGSQGEGISGGLAVSNAANVNAGGGGSNVSTGRGPGGGGGHVTTGSTGIADGSATAGSGGSVGSDSSDLTNIQLGGGGGGASANAQTSVGAGGSGGTIIILISKSIILSNTISVNGGLGGQDANSSACGGSGAAGSILMIGSTINLGANQATAIGGAGNISGGTGRIAIHHSGIVTGTTNPTFTDVLDHSLIQSAGGIFII